MRKYTLVWLSFILPFSLYLPVTLDASSLYFSLIFMNLFLLILCIYNVISLYRQHLNYWLVPVFVLSGLIPVLIINNVTDVNSGVISFGDYFYFSVIFIAMIIPIFTVSGIVCLCLFVNSKLRSK